ncbi:GNAT family N-acetyltransferase [Agromyces tropicus]|uniref:GNAT family N-acetyltransferase n=1 Tax=Agromyces tropicus TaxID=555371 RepID=A0ABP5G795_9MICO
MSSTPAPALGIRLADLADPRVIRLLEDHLADMYATSPAESVHALDVSGLSVPEVLFWTIGEGEALLGCVALKELDPEHGELKSMRTDAAARGRGLGARLLEHVLGEAGRRGYRRISLETGSEEFFLPARRLYARYGFAECPPFADYALDPNSVFMTLELPVA